MEIKVFVVDDEPDSLELVSSMIEKHCDSEICGTSQDADNALEQINILRPNLVICDVQMPGKSGIELAREIRKIDNKIEIVFITAYDSFALDAIKLEALDYILKPVDEEELFFVLDKLHSKIQADPLSDELRSILNEMRKSDKLRFNNMTGFILLRPSEIFYIQADGNYSNIYLTDGNMEVASQNLLCLEKKLSEHNFFRFSRSHLLNMEYVTGIDRKKKQCILKNGEMKATIPIPAERIKEISKKL